MRALHGAVPGVQYRQGFESERSDSGVAVLSAGGRNGVRGSAAGAAYFGRGGVRVHDVRRVRGIVSGGDSAFAGDHRAAARGGEYGDVGGLVWHEAVPHDGAEREFARDAIGRAREVYREGRAAAV